MRLFGGASREDRDAYRDARENLAAVARGKTEEDDEFAAANHAVIEAAQKLPWWQR
jgi:hypothetical protein